MSTLALLSAILPAGGARADDGGPALTPPTPAQHLVAVPKLVLDPAFSSVGPLGVPYEHQSDGALVAARTTLACLGSFVFPGLGHAAIGAYMPKGLAFTGGFVASVAGAVTFVVVGTDRTGNLQGPALLGAITLAVIADVIYLWSIIDSLAEAAHVPADTPGGGPRQLGAR